MRNLILIAVSAFLMAGQTRVPPALALPTGSGTQAVAVNRATNRVYAVANDVIRNEIRVFVIDAQTETVIAIIPSLGPFSGRLVTAVANRDTNKIYITDGEAKVHVIDGATNTVAKSIALGAIPRGVGINAVTNRIYVTHANVEGRAVSVINGQSDTIVATIPLETFRLGSPGVNATTNKIYVAGNPVHVIDGMTHEVMTIPVEAGDDDRVAANSVTNRIYITHKDGSRVLVIDGSTDTLLTTIRAGGDPSSVAANPETNRIYVGNRRARSFKSDVKVIDGGSNTVVQALPVQIPIDIAANVKTNRFYVAAAENVMSIYGGEVLLNPSFEGDDDQDGHADQWRRRGLERDDGLEFFVKYEAGYSFRINGTPGVDKALRQVVDRVGSSGALIHLEGVSKADAPSPSGGTYAITARVRYADGTSGRIAGLNFPKSTHAWVRKTKSYAALKPFDQIVVEVRYQDQTGTAWFDGLHLWIEQK